MRAGSWAENVQNTHMPSPRLTVTKVTERLTNQVFAPKSGRAIPERIRTGNQEGEFFIQCSDVLVSGAVQCSAVLSITIKCS